MPQSRLQQLLNLLEEDRTDSFLQFAIAQEYEQLGKDDLALSYYQKLLDDNPDYIGTYYHLAQHLYRRGDIDRAIAICDTGIKAAEAASDHHSVSELRTARINFSLDL